MVKHCPVCGDSNLVPQQEVKDHSISGEVFQLVGCPSCSLRITADAPAAADIGAYYASDQYISHSDTRESLMDKIYHRVRRSMLKRKREIVVESTHKTTGHLLDIGSGTGYFPAFMQEKGWTVEGIEVDDETRKRSIQKFKISVGDQGQVYQLTPNTYDAITMWHVLEHVEDLSGYGQSIYKALKEDGVLIIAVPNYTSGDAQYYNSLWAAWDVPRHLWHFSPKALEAFARQNGFEVQDMQPMPMDAYYVSMLSEKYKGSSGLTALVKGVWHGLQSNIRSAGHPERSSSVIYLLKKKK